jgi:hypothetical protein
MSRWIVTALATAGAYLMLPALLPVLHRTAFPIGRNETGFTVTYLLIVCLVVAVFTYRATK